MEYTPQDSFLKYFFQGLGGVITWQGVTRLLVKQAGLVLPDPTKMDPDNWKVSYLITAQLVAAIRGREEFWTADHATTLCEGRGEVRRMNVFRLESALEEILSSVSTKVTRRLQRVMKMGAWLTLQLYTVCGTELGVQE